MGISETYKLNKPILSIFSDANGHRIPIMVPVGSLVTVANGPLDGLRMVDVVLDEKTVMMFTTDLRDRGTLVKKAKSTD